MLFDALLRDWLRSEVCLCRLLEAEHISPSSIPVSLSLESNSMVDDVILDKPSQGDPAGLCLLHCQSSLKS